jgi:hypothetical protein
MVSKVSRDLLLHHIFQKQLAFCTVESYPWYPVSVWGQAYFTVPWAVLNLFARCANQMIYSNHSENVNRTRPFSTWYLLN